LGSQATALVAAEANMVAWMMDELPPEFGEDSLKCTEYLPTGHSVNDSVTLFRLEYCNPHQELCWEFVNWLELLFRNQPTFGQLIAPFPGVTALTKTISVQIPADAVTIAVDTRPACEWL
jgi:hypothetical protein